ncbi:MAG: M28 family peptidase [Solirubrobacteraceae bacterium]|nr:M28 family peptidase [Solirubrobacteraceae bacterium]
MAQPAVFHVPAWQTEGDERARGMAGTVCSRALVLGALLGLFLPVTAWSAAGQASTRGATAGMGSDGGAAPATLPLRSAVAHPSPGPAPLARRAAAAPIPAGLSTTDEIMTDVRALVDLGPRRSGTPGGDRAAEFMKRRLTESGIPQVWEHNVPTYQWEETRSKVSVGGQTIDAFASEHSFFGAADPTWTGSFSTGAGGRTAKVVDVGDGGTLDMLGKDLRGKIVMFNLRFQIPMLAMGAVSEHLYDPGLSLLNDPRGLLQGNPYITNYTSVLREARRRGAVGFVGVLTDYFESNRYRNEYYRRLQVTMPGFWVTRDEGRRMRSLLPKAGRTATLELEGRRYATPTRTVIGYLPGKSRETIMVQSHHDSVGPGAVEDASGSASVIALAKYYAAQPAAERERGLLFVTFDSHFTGYQSHQAFVKQYIVAEERPFDIVANATVEHIALQGVIRGGKLVMTNRPEPRAFFRTGGNVVRQTLVEAIRKRDLRRTIIINARTVSEDGSMPTDASYGSAMGVPTASFVSGPIYLYDDMDTIDKVDQAQLRPVTAAFVDIVDRFDVTTARALKGR